MTRLRSALVALRDFARGFVGLAAPGAAATDAAVARQQIRDAADRRPHCC